MKITGSHIKLSGTPPSVRMPSPALGENNADIYGDLLGVPEEELKKLIDEGVV
jgi:crotonobetainyl-CoA:carnitine CoA-transferase CaiB-like acyl-CoA transferase